MALAVLPFSAVEVQRKGGSRAATLHAALDATILDLRTAANSDAVYLGEKGCVDGDLLSELAEFSRPRSDKALRIVVSSVRGDRGGSKEKVWLRNHVRGRSYGPVGEWLLARLAPLQVVERPEVRRSLLKPDTWLEGDVHHRIDLRIAADGTVAGGSNVPRKGPRTKALPPDAWARVDAAVQQVLTEAVGAAVAAPAGADAPAERIETVSLPLWPQPGHSESLAPLSPSIPSP